jgi:hypothetical protein
MLVQRLGVTDIFNINIYSIFQTVVVEHVDNGRRPASRAGAQHGRTKQSVMLFV